MANTGWSVAADAESDVKKKAFLIKIKTSRKKFFVLREKSPSGPARLEYYDSEKKFRAGVVTKRCIVLKNCLSISSKVDLRHPFAIYLYTRDNYFGVAFENEATQQDWLTTMLDLRSMQEENTLTKPLFEHIWPVKMTTKALGLPTGPYHLCLTNTEISLIRLNHDDPPVVLPLECIRRCGHSHGFFFLETGRSASTGAGELWLQIEDTVIAQNIHEATLNAMRTNPQFPIEPYRPRTRSNADHKKRPNQPATGMGLVPKRANSVSFHNKEQQSTGAPCSSAVGVLTPLSANVNSQSERLGGGGLSRLDLGLVSSIGENDAGYPSSVSTRSLTPDDKIEEEPSYFPMDASEKRPLANADTNSVRGPPDGVSVDYMVINPVAPGGGATTKTSQSSSSSTYMPMPGHPISSSGGGSSTAVMRSKTMSYAESAMESAAGRNVSRSATSSMRRSAASTVSSSPATSVSEYMEMACPANNCAATGKTNAGEQRKSTEAASASDAATSRRSTSNASVAAATSRSSSGTGAALTGSGCNNNSDYMAMKPTDEGYMDMKAGHLLSDEKVHGSSSSVSSVVSFTSGTVSSVASSRSGAVESEPAFHSLSRLPETTNDGYMEMSAQNVSTSLAQCVMMGMRLDIVHSYLRDDDAKKEKSGLTGGEDFPKRAYSVGSKPSPDLGGRQLTTGSYVDMSGTGGLSPADRHLSLKKEAEKSNSAPHLNDDGSGQNTTTTTSNQHQTAGLAAEGGDLFMELDFNKKGGLIGRDFRDRASSGGSKDFRSWRTLSYGAKDILLSRISFMRGSGDKTGSGGHIGSSHGMSDRRPRTSTICQESLRPRTSSFGTNIDDSRPRSSSGGNARLCDVFGPEARVGAWRPPHGVNSSSGMSSKQISVNSSVDSLGAGADYTDMCPGRSACSRTLNAHSSVVTRAVEDDDYMSMKPGEETKTVVSGSSDYMPMAPVAASKPSSEASSTLQSSSTQAVRKLSSSKTAGDSAAPAAHVEVAATTTTPVIYPLFDIEFSPTTLHYAAPDPSPLTSGGASTATVPSAIALTHGAQANCSSGTPSRHADVNNSNSSAAAAAAAVTAVSTNSVVKSRIVNSTNSTDVERGSRHVYAEIDFSG